MRVLWPHNFDPDIPVAGVFMYTSHRALATSGVIPEMLYLGNLRGPLRLYQAYRAAAKAAAGAQMIHCQFGSAAALACSRVGQCPRLVSLRGSDWTRAYSHRPAGRLHSRMATLFTRMCLRRYDAVICVSHRMAAEVQAEFPGIVTHVLPCPIDLDLFTPLNRATARRSLGLPDDGHRYVIFGSAKSNNPIKRRWLAEAAVKWVQERMPKVSLLAATGYPHEMMPTVFSAADVAICTSTSEGWPNFIKEALACNVPFVSTDVSDLSQVVAHEPACHVVDPTAEALGGAVLHVLEQPHPTGLRRHVFDMRLERHAAQLLDIYRTALAR
jgi:teichuronic acid biosynthesis glycosyltransferase TuaC